MITIDIKKIPQHKDAKNLETLSGFTMTQLLQIDYLMAIIILKLVMLVGSGSK